MAKIQIKRGIEANLPIGDNGELLWTTDTYKLFIGDGILNTRINWINSLDISQFTNDSGYLTSGDISISLSMPSAFSVTGSPTGPTGTFTVTGAGVASQYVRGDGSLGNFPSISGGGASVNYYLNGSIPSGVVGYEQMSKTPVGGIGADYTIATPGYIASFLTDALDPGQLSIPAGNWIVRCYFQSSSTGGSPNFYVELYKYNGVFTLLASSSVNPEVITGGTAVDLYTTGLAVPATMLLLTDRLAIRIYVNNSGRTITLHTENGNLCEVTTTFSTGITALNGLTTQNQYFATGSSGTDFNIASAIDTHTFNLPTASATNRGALSSADWTTFNDKVSSVSGIYVDNTDPINPVVDVQPLEDRVTDLENLTSLNTGSYFLGQAYAIWTGVGLTYDVIWPSYYLDGVLYSAGTNQITLTAADPSNPRLDVIGVDDTGAMFITGIPAIDPVKPTVDPITQLEITVVLIGAGATAPTGIVDEIIYNENTEAVVSSNNGSVNPINTIDPFTGIYHISCGSFNNTHYIDFTFGSPKQVTDYSILRYYIRLLATFTSTTYLRLQFFDGATSISSLLNVTSGSYNWLRTNIAGYQIVTVPLSAFTFSQSEFTRIRITFNNSNATGFYFDYFTLQNGTPTVTPLQNAITEIVTDSGIASSTQANDQFFINGQEGTIVTASGKTINIKSLPLITTSGTDTYIGSLTGLTAYVAGQTFKILISNTNTGPSTLNINSLGAIPLTKEVVTALSASDLIINGIYIVIYDGTNFQIIGLGGGGGGHTIQDEGTPLTQRTNLNFVGASVAVTDDAGNDATVVAISGGSGQSLGASFDGMGAVVLVNSIFYIRAKSAMTITEWSIIAEGTSPTCTIDIFKIASGTTLPTASICASALPALATGNAIKSTTLTGWTTSVAADDMLAFKVTACSAATKIQIVLYP